jgi:arsenate reductase-like glutaredoxin family protein
MAEKYVTRCLVKRHGEYHKKGTMFNDLSKDEIAQGLAQHWLEKVGYEAPVVPGNNRKPDREKLLKKAAELSIKVTDAMTNEEIQKLIADAYKNKPDRKALEELALKDGFKKPEEIKSLKDEELEKLLRDTGKLK